MNWELDWGEFGVDGWWLVGLVGGGERTEAGSTPRLKIMGVVFLVGVVPLKELLSKLHKAFLSGNTWRSIGVGSYAFATAHTFVCENVLGAFLMQFIKLEVLDIPGEYPMLMDDLTEKSLFLYLSWDTA